MFVRWRRRPSGRLSARLVHNQRVAGRVRQRHVEELGAISVAALHMPDEIQGIVARRTFWRTANAALARVAGLIDGSHEAVIRAALEARVPSATPEELRRLALLQAEREGRFWGKLAGDFQFGASVAEGQASERQSQLGFDRVLQWAAGARHSTLSRGGALDEQREFPAQRICTELRYHGIDPSCVPNGKALEELSDDEFEMILKHCTQQTEEQAIR